MTTVELPGGVKHHSTSTFAESWAAYDALTVDDGWRETRRFDGETGEPRLWKNGEIRGHSITVHSPRFRREVAA